MTRITCIAALALAATSLGDPIAHAQDDPRPWGPPPPVVVREGKSFRVLCHFDTARLADEALSAVELAWDVTHELIDARPKKVELMDVHLYRGRDDYNAAESRITGGRFKDNLAFSVPTGPAAYVALQPELDDTVFAQVGLSSRTLRTAVHEACHLALYTAMSNHELHPHWLAEGMATTVADRALIEAGLAPDSPAAPTSSTRMRRMLRLLEADKLPSPRTILTTDLPDLDHTHQYTVWWAFFQYLAEHNGGKRAQQAIDAVRPLGGGDDFRERATKAVEKAWGKKAIDKTMADEFRDFVRAFRPEWDETFGTVRVEGDTWTQLAWPETNALAWRTAPVGRSKYSISGSFELLYSTNPQANLLLARRDAGFVSIAFRAGSGVTVFDQRAEGNQWNKIGWMEAPGLKIGNEVEFEVSVRGQKLSISVDGGDALSWELPGVDFEGAWGVGVQSNGAAIWRGVKLD